MIHDVSDFNILLHVEKMGGLRGCFRDLTSTEPARVCQGALMTSSRAVWGT